MGRRSRQRVRQGEQPEPMPQASSAGYSDPEGNELELRGALSLSSRRRYARMLDSGLHREDARQRAIELLFEQLAVSWTIAAAPITSQKELLARYRMASRDERQFVLESLRAHAAEHFPELELP